MNIILCKYGILFPMGDIYSFFIICLIIFEVKTGIDVINPRYQKRNAIKIT